ncbi:MAG: prepilin-type N-terminal cleavage/methylation domain-containing protein [Bdellovibrionota bacterium]
MTQGRSPKSVLRDNRGFTLIELLATMSIIGILSAIASHEFVAYTQRAYDARAAGDIRDAATAEEAYYSENESYLDCAGTTCDSLLPGFLASIGVQVEITSRDAQQAFDAMAQHPAGEKVFHYSNDVGSISWVPRS